MHVVGDFAHEGALVEPAEANGAREALAAAIRAVIAVT